MGEKGKPEGDKKTCTYVDHSHNIRCDSNPMERMRSVQPKKRYARCEGAGGRFQQICRGTKTESERLHLDR